MSDQDLIIQSFQYGLDARRSELTSKPGSLVQCENAHINQGAQVEKRNAFVRLPFPAGTFGADATINGLVVYGSSATPSGLAAWPSFNTSWGANNPPLSYLILVAPFGVDAMTGVIWSTPGIGGLPFIIAQYASGRVYVFQATATGADVVTDFYSGLVLNGLTSTVAQALNLANLINETTNYTATSNGSVVTITGENGSQYTASTVITSAAGVITANQISTAAAGTTGLQAVGSFIIQGGQPGGGTNVSSIMSVAMFPVNGGGPTPALLSSSVYWNTDAPTTAAAVAANINANFAGNGGFSATSNGNVINVYAPLGTAWNGYTLEIRTALSTDKVGAICLGNCTFNFFVPATGGPTLTISSIVATTAGTLTSTSRSLSSFASLNALLVQIATDINTVGTMFAAAVGNSLLISYYYDADPLVVPATSDTITINYTASAGVTVGGAQGLAVTTDITQVAAATSNSNITTNIVTATVTGGTSPYKYRWKITNQVGPGTITIGSPTAAATSFTFVNPYQTALFSPGVPLTTTKITATAVLTITDANGSVASANVGIAIVYSYIR